MHSQITNGDLYDIWIKAKTDAYLVVSEGSHLRKFEIPRGEIFDIFLSDNNIDARDGEDEVVVREQEIENESEVLGENELT